MEGNRVALAGCIAASMLSLCACGSTDSSVSATAETVIATTTAAASSAPPIAAGPTAEQVVDAFESAGLPATGRANRTIVSGCPDLGCLQMIAVDQVSVYQFKDQVRAEKYATTMSSSMLIYRNGLLVLRFKRDGPNPIDRTLIPQYQAALDKLTA